MIGPHNSAVVRSLYSAAALQQPQVHRADSVVVESPLPGGVAQVVRFLLNTVPPWVQIGGLVLGVLVGALLVWVLFSRRRAIREWLTARTRPVRVALVGVAVALLVGAATMGAATWNYTQHSNDFCTGCHVMNPAFQRMATVESRHSELSCHACHQQTVFASARQLYLWIAERPQEIGEHAKVANQICENCHVTGDTATWQRIAATAGHRVHLESDSSALDDLQCVTCHGVEVHRFNPVAETCGQSECHDPRETGIVLGKMAGQTVRHCTSCHSFTADVPALATTDSARGTLVPGKPECLGCHEMRQIMGVFDERRDPHGGKCGTCHNPHEQETPGAAANTCATAGCHSNWRDEPFHTGASHRRVASQCLTCHLPHSARVDASDCQRCHESVRARGKFQPPVPFDTTRALRRVNATQPLQSGETAGARLGDAIGAGYGNQPNFVFASFVRSTSWSGSAPRAGRAHRITRRANVSPAAAPLPPRPPPAAADSFSHARHARLACLECHQTGEGHGRLTFEPPRGCAICHHQAPTTSRCASCHQPREYNAPKQATVTVTVPGRQPRPRPVDFLHSVHSGRPCLECHTTPVTLLPPVSKAQCRECHTEHHSVGRNCSSCHRIADPKAAHTTLEVAHQRCDACHTATTVARLTPTRSFCSTCHLTRATNHYDQKECSVCHFLAEPGAHRSTLLTRPAG